MLFNFVGQHNGARVLGPVDAARVCEGVAIVFRRYCLAPLFNPKVPQLATCGVDMMSVVNYPVEILEMKKFLGYLYVWMDSVKYDKN